MTAMNALWFLFGVSTILPVALLIAAAAAKRPPPPQPVPWRVVAVDESPGDPLRSDDLRDQEAVEIYRLWAQWKRENNHDRDSQTVF